MKDKDGEKRQREGLCQGPVVCEKRLRLAEGRCAWSVSWECVEGWCMEGLLLPPRALRVWTGEGGRDRCDCQWKLACSTQLPILTVAVDAR